MVLILPLRVTRRISVQVDCQCRWIVQSRQNCLPAIAFIAS
jgi:hypothetical protein